MEKFPLHKAFTFLEPDPVVLVTTAEENRPNIMTLSWMLAMQAIIRDGRVFENGINDSVQDDFVNLDQM